jgi:hypothetical protein
MRAGGATAFDSQRDLARDESPRNAHAKAALGLVEADDGAAALAVEMRVRPVCVLGGVVA